MKYPQIDPVAFHLGPIAVHWYGLMYLFGFLIAWLLCLWRARQPNSHWNYTLVSDLIFYSAVGVILGGRLGYMIFYSSAELIHDPLSLLKIWQGGMSFHGGLIGVLIALWLFCRHKHKNMLDVMDFIAPVIPIGLGLGRLGNFINGELWGRVTTAPWGMVFPDAGPQTRHPSQLYEAIFEGLILFLILWIYSSKPRPRFSVSALFLLCYGLFRFCIEFFREPDVQLGFIFGNWLTMGQLLSIPMFLVGALFFIHQFLNRKNIYKEV